MRVAAEPEHREVDEGRVEDGLVPRRLDYRIGGAVERLAAADVQPGQLAVQGRAKAARVLAGSNTAENASRSLPLMLAQSGVRRVSVVTSAWHLRTPCFFAPYRAHASTSGCARPRRCAGGGTSSPRRSDLPACACSAPSRWAPSACPTSRQTAGPRRSLERVVPRSSRLPGLPRGAATGQPGEREVAPEDTAATV